MFKDYTKILRLHRKGLSCSRIAESLGCRWHTVRDAAERLEKVWGSLDYVPQDLSDDEIASVLRNHRAGYDFFPIDEETVLKKQRHGKQRSEIWAEYVDEAYKAGKQPYKLTRFNEIVTKFAKKNEISVNITRKPGIKCEVDWTGSHGHFIDADTGKLVDVHIFVMALPYSGYFYCEGFLDEKMKNWLEGHIKAFEFFGGTPVVVVPDNCKTGVTKGRWSFDQDVVLNSRYKEFLNHYGLFAEPARVYRPTDKSVVERSVGIIERDILPELERLSIHSLEEFNSLLKKKLLRRLERPYSRRYGSRKSVFECDEKETLQPLPVVRYGSYPERKATVSKDSMIQVGKAFYSVPAQYIGQIVLVRSLEETLFIYNNSNKLIAEHRKATREWQRVIDPSHFKYDMAKYGGYSLQNFLDRARSYGNNMHEWVKQTAASKEYEAESYRTLQGVFNEARNYRADVVDAVAAKAVRMRYYTTSSFKKLLKAESSRLKELEEEKRQPNLNGIYLSHEGDE